MAHLGIIKINKMHLSHWLLQIVEQQIKIIKKYSVKQKKNAKQAATQYNVGALNALQNNQ